MIGEMKYLLTDNVLLVSSYKKLFISKEYTMINKK